MSRLSHIKVKFGEVEVLNSTFYAITLPGTPFGRLNPSASSGYHRSLSAKFRQRNFFAQIC